MIIPDVLRLLASTKKTGLLRLDGSRGLGSLWVDQGNVVAGEVSASPHSSDADEILFELLRFESGDFVFEDGLASDDPGTPQEVEPLLASAEAMLGEWKGIEAVVPSLDHHVRLVAELGAPEVTVSAESWSTLASVGGGISVGRLGDHLGLGELGVSKAVKALVELGLVEVGDPREEEVFAGSAESDEPVGAFGSFEEELSGGDDGGLEEFESFDPDGLVIEDDELSFDDGAEAEVEEESTDAKEIARQLANLTPKPAKAAAAAAKAPTVEEREAALAEVDDEDDPINRDLLIKFLGSVND